MKWEYKAIEVEDVMSGNNMAELEGNLNKYGEEGWELATLLHEHCGGSGWTPQIKKDILIFKKEK